LDANVRTSQIKWPSVSRRDTLSPKEFASAIRALDAALAANEMLNEDGSTQLIPLALSLLREEFAVEARLRRKLFTQAVCCVNISSTQYVLWH
jgi:hypothetical protein